MIINESISVDYFKDMWIDYSNCQDGRRQPKFGIEIWNCYDSV